MLKRTGRFLSLVSIVLSISGCPGELLGGLVMGKSGNSDSALLEKTKEDGSSTPAGDASTTSDSAITPGDMKGPAVDTKAPTVDTKVPTAKFSFFVTSLAALRKLSGSQNGFGGDLRFGETGPGAGLRGADKICATIAETSMPGASAKKWRAFLSVSADENGKQVNAIDRIGNGPWYDRLGRLVAPTRNDLLHDRPQNGDPAIVNDLPNEEGIPNHQPDPSKGQVDNHHTMTGSNTAGQLSPNRTCQDWTSSTITFNGPSTGLSWPRVMGGFGGSANSNWIFAYNAPGCTPGVDINSYGPAPPGTTAVGSGGGYGGFYCFALVP